MKVNPINIIWETQPDAVEEELKKILGVEELNICDPVYFQQRNAAAKRVLNQMSVQDRARFADTLEARRIRGNPEPVRRE